MRVDTIGYEGATPGEFIDTVRDAGIELLVDVRAVAMSRRPGFAKTRLAANLAEAGIEYLHLKGLGTPADGRAAAKAGHHAEMHRIFRKHMKTDVAQADLATLVSIIQGGRRVCLLCFERDPARCHRSLVMEALMAHLPIEASHLFAQEADAD